MKEQTKAPEKIQLSNEKIANLSDAQFKTLVIRLPTEMVEYGHKMEEKMKAMPVSYTHLTLPTILGLCRSRWSPYH